MAYGSFSWSEVVMWNCGTHSTGRVGVAGAGLGSGFASD